MAFPFENIRILDLTRLIPGAVCTLMLADGGADVIKIEQPGTGDYMRWYVPRVGEYAALFHALNRNKRSLTLDLKKPAGMDILKKLIATADVLVENFRPAVTRRMELAYENLKAINPRLIMCSISGYGQTGPLANIAGHNLNFAAITGITAAGKGRVLPITALDNGGAYLAVYGIAAALFQRERTGEGSYIDAALLDAGISLTAHLRAAAFAENTSKSTLAEMLGGDYACYHVYQTSDGQYIAAAPLEEKFWQNFCNLIGRSDLAEMAYLAPENQEKLVSELTAIIAGKTFAEWTDILEGSETCVTPVVDVIQSADHPALQAREVYYMSEEVAHTRTPVKIGTDSTVQHRPAPILGADTVSLLQEINISAEKIEKLRVEKVI